MIDGAKGARAQLAEHLEGRPRGGVAACKLRRQILDSCLHRVCHVLHGAMTVTKAQTMQ